MNVKRAQNWHRYFGGSTNLLDKSDMTNWVSTVAANPWLFRGQLRPIYELVKDEQKKRQLSLATQAHLDKAYLKVAMLS